MNIKLRRTLLAIALAIPLSACGSGQNTESPTAKQLGAFRFAQSCEDVKSYARGFADRVKKSPNQAVPIAAPAAAPTAPSGASAPEATAADSAGNGGAVVQSDLAFPDLGRGLLYTLSNQQEMRVFQVSPASQAQLSATLSLDFYPTEVVATQAGDRFFAVIFGTTGGFYGVGPQPMPAQTLALQRGKSLDNSPPQSISSTSPIVPNNVEEPKSVMALVNVSNPEQPKILREELAPGYFLEARALSGQGKIVWISEYYVPLYGDALTDDQILPKKIVRISGAASQSPLADCAQSYLYENSTLDPNYAPSSLNESVISLLDLNQPDAAVVTQAIYSPAWRTLVAANDQHLFLAQNLDNAGGSDSEIYQFELGGTSLLALSASTSLPGQILNQFFLDEKDGVLRVFHQVQDFGPICADCVMGGSSGSGVPAAAMKAQATSAAGNYLSTFKKNGEQLELQGRTGPFDADETSFAARFVGNLGCVITFHQIDPLSCFNLKDPSQPTKLGELKIQGVTFHLEAITDTLLLGIGQGGDNNSVVANLFDISNPAQPTLAAQKTLSSGEYAYSSAFYDYRALGKDEASRNFAVPFEDSTGSTLALFSIDPSAKQIHLGGSLHQNSSAMGPYDSFQRAFFFSDTLAAVSYQNLNLFLRSDLSPVFSSSLTN